MFCSKVKNKTSIIDHGCLIDCLVRMSWCIMPELQYVLRMFLTICSLIFFQIFPKMWSCLFTLRIIANYMVWHLIKPILVLLSKPYRTAALELSSKEIGTKGFEESWKNCITKTDSVLGFATGHLFVKEIQRSGDSSKHGVNSTFFNQNYVKCLLIV